MQQFREPWAARSLVLRALAWSCAAALTACTPHAPAAKGTPAPAAKQKVVVYSPHGREMLEPFQQRFAAVHPEIELQTLDMGSQEILDRVRAERANPQADLWWGAPHTMFIKAAADGLLQPYQPTWKAHLPAARHDAQDFWYGQYLTPSVIVYNSEALTAQTAPQDWDELLKPEWKGKILIRNPLESGTMRTFFAAMILGAPSVDEGFAWLQKLDANTKGYPPNPALLHRQMAKQEGVVTIWALRDVEIQKRTHGYPFGYVLPRSGSPVVLDAIALVKGAPHADAAKVFYEFATAREQMLWAAEQFDCMPARTDIKPAELPARMPKQVKEIKLDWAQVEANTKTWMDRWNRTVKTDK